LHLSRSWIASGIPIFPTSHPATRCSRSAKSAMLFSRKSGGEPIVAYMPAVLPELSSQVVLPSGIVCVNQYTGKVLGARSRGQTFLGLARALHVRPAGGSAGREIMKWSGGAILLSLASGLYLWWPGKRVRIRGGWRSRGFWFDLHNAIGILSFLPLVVLALTARRSLCWKN
jgi:uncharacterized iron-regulated membrane protein